MGGGIPGYAGGCGIGAVCMHCWSSKCEEEASRFAAKKARLKAEAVELVSTIEHLRRLRDRNAERVAYHRLQRVERLLIECRREERRAIHAKQRAPIGMTTPDQVRAYQRWTELRQEKGDGDKYNLLLERKSLEHIVHEYNPRGVFDRSCSTCNETKANCHKRNQQIREMLESIESNHENMVMACASNSVGGSETSLGERIGFTQAFREDHAKGRVKTLSMSVKNNRVPGVSSLVLFWRGRCGNPEIVSRTERAKRNGTPYYDPGTKVQRDDERILRDKRREKNKKIFGKTKNSDPFHTVNVWKGKPEAENGEFEEAERLSYEGRLTIADRVLAMAHQEMQGGSFLENLINATRSEDVKMAREMAPSEIQKKLLALVNKYRDMAILLATERLQRALRGFMARLKLWRLREMAYKDRASSLISAAIRGYISRRHTYYVHFVDFLRETYNIYFPPELLPTRGFPLRDLLHDPEKRDMLIDVIDKALPRVYPHAPLCGMCNELLATLKCTHRDCVYNTKEGKKRTKNAVEGMNLFCTYCFAEYHSFGHFSAHRSIDVHYRAINADAKMCDRCGVRCPTRTCPKGSCHADFCTECYVEVHEDFYKPDDCEMFDAFIAGVYKNIPSRKWWSWITQRRTMRKNGFKKRQKQGIVPPNESFLYYAEATKNLVDIPSAMTWPNFSQKASRALARSLGQRYVLMEMGKRKRKHVRPPSWLSYWGKCEEKREASLRKQRAFMRAQRLDEAIKRNRGWIKIAFDRYDDDQSGWIDRDELRKLLTFELAGVARPRMSNKGGTVAEWTKSSAQRKRERQEREDRKMMEQKRKTDAIRKEKEEREAAWRKELARDGLSEAQIDNQIRTRHAADDKIREELEEQEKKRRREVFGESSSEEEVHYNKLNTDTNKH